MKEKQEQTVAFIMLVIIFGFIFGGQIFYGWYSCKSKADAQDMEYSYGIIKGCMVKQDNKWIDYDRLRFMD